MLENSYDLVSDTKMGAPHVVILGAGASVAAFPNGINVGNPLPLMNDLVRVCELESILNKYGIEYDGSNFEDFYSKLHNQGHESCLMDIENTIFKFFNSLELPSQPTIYDLLAISLRPKDLIATFNWDPFLWQALKRNYLWAPGPQAVFLHGNVAIGYCLKDRTLGPRGAKCTKCSVLYRNAKLLYPISEKNYYNDPFIKESWNTLQKFLERAYILTIFGYSAPHSDVEAIRLMKEAWGSVDKRSLEQTEIIDIKDKDVLQKTWYPFIHTHHFEIHKNFQESILAQHPRRSCEAMWAMLMECHFLDENPIPDTQDWQELREWFSPRILVEKK